MSDALDKTREPENPSATAQIQNRVSAWKRFLRQRALLIEAHVGACCFCLIIDNVFSGFWVGGIFSIFLIGCQNVQDLCLSDNTRQAFHKLLEQKLISRSY